MTVKKHVFPGLPRVFRRWTDLLSSKRWDEVMWDVFAGVLMACLAMAAMDHGVLREKLPSL